MTNRATARDATMRCRRIADGLPAASTIAGHIMNRFVVTSPLPTTVPLAMLRRDVLAMVGACLEVAAGLLDGGDYRKPLAEVRTCAMDWAQAGVPIDAMQHATHEGLTSAFDHVLARLRTEDEPMIVAGVARAFVEIVHRIATAISQAYLTEIRDVREESFDALASAVMAGTATPAMARACGMQPAADYLVFAVQFAPHIDESDPRLDRHLIAHRRIRRVRAEISRWCGESALMSLAASGGTLLIPAPALNTDHAERFIEAISAAAQVPVRATFLSAGIDAVPETLAHLDAMLELMRRLRRVGLHAFHDLSLEYQLSRPGAARDRIASVLAPLEDQPMLLETLLTHLETRATRLSTAKALHVHPNTVDYRLERIAEETGLDPRSSEDVWRLRSAVVARLAGDVGANTRAPDEQTPVPAQAC